LSDETLSAAKSGLTDKRIARTNPNSELQIGGIPAAVTFHAELPTPTILIVEVSGSPDEVIEGMESLAGVCDPGTSVIVIGSENDITLYRTLISKGVTDYLVVPVAPQQIADAVYRVIADPNAREPARIISFYGARGGVGSSSIAQNMAWVISEAFDDDVMLVDLDLQFGTAALDFNLELPQTIRDAISDPGRLDSQLLEKCVGKYSDNLSVLASPASPDMPADVSIPALDKLLEVAGSMASTLVLDLPHSWSPGVAHALAQSDEIVVVASLDLACLRNAQNVIRLINKDASKEMPIHMVVNKAGRSQRTELSRKDFESAIGDKVELSIDDDPQTFGAAENSGQPAAESQSKSKLKGTFEGLAIDLIGQKAIKKGGKKSWRDWLKK
jgi:pilus assembly protein CpaE